MFSMRQKRKIANEVQKILRETNHSELPKGEIEFELYVKGEDKYSWANIKNNASVINPGINIYNEMQDKDQKL